MTFATRARLKRQLNQKEIERNGLLNKLKQIRQNIFEKRKQCAVFLSETLGPKISAEVITGGNTKKYYKTLREALRGSWVYSRDLEKIVKNISPFEHFEIVQKKQVDELIKNIDISDHLAEAIVHFEPLREKLYEIQQVPLPDKPRNLLEVGGVQKTLDSTSLGQRCTTLLSLIMLESEPPLIVDTPEEVLDNIFVFDSVVKNLRIIKEGDS